MPDDPARTDALLACLREWPVSHALLRAIECRKIRSHALAPPVLDLGCGDGFLSGIVFDAPLDAGVELRAGDAARARARGHHNRVSVADAASLPFEDSSFSSVFSNCVLEHIDRLPDALSEIARVLAPGGSLLATVPTPRWESEGPFPALRRAGLHGVSGRLARLLRRLWHHVTMDDREGWAARLSRNGFDLIAWEPYMGPAAYGVYARHLPGSALASLAEKTVVLGPIVRGARRLAAARRSQRLRDVYLVEEEAGTCALFVAIRR